MSYAQFTKKHYDRAFTFVENAQRISALWRSQKTKKGGGYKQMGGTSSYFHPVALVPEAIGKGKKGGAFLTRPMENMRQNPWNGNTPQVAEALLGLTGKGKKKNNKVYDDTESKRYSTGWRRGGADYLKGDRAYRGALWNNTY